VMQLVTAMCETASFTSMPVVDDALLTSSNSSSRFRTRSFSAILLPARFFVDAGMGVSRGAQYCSWVESLCKFHLDSGEDTNYLSWGKVEDDTKNGRRD